LIARPTTVVLDYVVVHMMTDELGLRNSIASVTQARFAVWVCAVVVQSLIMAGVVAIAAGTVSAIVAMDGIVRDMILYPVLEYVDLRAWSSSYLLLRSIKLPPAQAMT
jgi:hypothetical protein